jgi:RNA polymerase sigma factor (sigma-70 family)
MEQATDEQLLQRSGDGEPRQFAVLWDRHSPRVYRHLVAATRDVFSAEDLTAGAFLELWRRRSRVRFVDGSALPWLLVTASNLAANSKRAARRHRALLAKLPRSSEIVSPSGIGEGIHDERIDVVNDVMQTVNAKDRNLLVLTVLEGFSVREAAQIVGVTEGAAKMRLHRLRGRIATAVVAVSVVEG